MRVADRAATGHRPTVAVVDLDAIGHNLRTLRPERAEVMAVVKANAYGHGDVEVASAALVAGATWLAVALVEEGIRLRDAGIEAPVLVLSELPPGSEAEALARGLTPSLYSDDGLRRLAAAAGAAGAAPGVHVKVDTGMHRVGVPAGDADRLVRNVLEAGLHLDGLWTHFAMAEDPQDPFTAEQLRRFLEVAGRLEAAGIRPRYLHAANTAAIMAGPEYHLDLVRLGIGLYGLSPGPGCDPLGRFELRPAMRWTSAVALTKRIPAGEGVSYGLQYRPAGDATLATVPVGYADGYSRLLEGAEVLIRGRRYPVAGSITMDQLLVDCGDDLVEPGDEVVLIGSQGHEEVTSMELADLIGTVSYEVVCRVSERVPRTYVGVQ